VRCGMDEVSFVMRYEWDGGDLYLYSACSG